MPRPKHERRPIGIDDDNIPEYPKPMSVDFLLETSVKGLPPVGGEEAFDSSGDCETDYEVDSKSVEIDGLAKNGGVKLRRA